MAKAAIDFPRASRPCCCCCASVPPRRCHRLRSHRPRPQNTGGWAKSRYIQAQPGFPGPVGGVLAPEAVARPGPIRSSLSHVDRRDWCPFGARGQIEIGSLQRRNPVLAGAREGSGSRIRLPLRRTDHRATPPARSVNGGYRWSSLLRRAGCQVMVGSPFSRLRSGAALMSLWPLRREAQAELDAPLAGACPNPGIRAASQGHPTTGNRICLLGHARPFPRIRRHLRGVDYREIRRPGPRGS